MNGSRRRSRRSAGRNSTSIPPTLSPKPAAAPPLAGTPIFVIAMRTRSLSSPSSSRTVASRARFISSSIAIVVSRGVPGTIVTLAKIRSASGDGKKTKPTRPPATMPAASSSSPTAAASVA